jgi:hypothetical protein
MAIEDNTDVKFTIFGLPADGYNVRADVFLAAVRSFLKALRVSDKEENESIAHDYLIADLSSGSNIITLRERRSPRKRKRYSVVRPASGINHLRRAFVAVYNAEKDTSRLSDKLMKSMEDVTRRAGIDFEHAEIEFDPENIIRIDDYLARQIDRVIYNEAPDEAPRYFTGVSYTSFDGVLKVADSRGALVRGKFVLTAGGKPIDCVFRQADIAEVRKTFSLRARAEAIAHYDGESLLPDRLDIRRLTLVKENADLTKWQGAFVAGVPADIGDDF